MTELLVDIYKVKNLYSGLGQFSMNFALELMKQVPENFHVSFLIPGNLTTGEFNNADLIKASYQKRYLPMFTRPYHIWHGLQQFPSHFPNRKSIFILTVHDLNFLIEKSEAKKIKYLKKMQQNIDRAQYITAISEFTKKTVENHIDLKGKHIRTIYNGISINTDHQGSKPDYMNGQKFLFSIGIFNSKKNFHVLLDAMKYLEDYMLVIAGNSNTEYGKYMNQRIIDLNLQSRVILPGKVSDDQRIWFLKNCEALLFPSLAEGFGMPVIEAMKFGKPVFISRNTSLPEIGGDVACYFENFQDEYIASFIKRHLKLYKENQEPLSESIKKHADKFSWQACITQYLELYCDIAEAHSL